MPMFPTIWPGSRMGQAPKEYLQNLKQPFPPRDQSRFRRSRRARPGLSFPRASKHTGPQRICFSAFESGENMLGENRFDMQQGV
jgi:hypothetical protein